MSPIINSDSNCKGKMLDSISPLCAAYSHTARPLLRHSKCPHHEASAGIEDVTVLQLQQRTEFAFLTSS